MIMMNETSSSPSTNTQSILSLIFGILTILTFCGGVFPIPLTGFVCFPASFLSALLALLLGVISLGQIRRRGEEGRSMAWIGIAIGGFAIISAICFVVMVILLFKWHSGGFPLPPMFDNYKI